MSALVTSTKASAAVAPTPDTPTDDMPTSSPAAAAPAPAPAAPAPAAPAAGPSAIFQIRYRRPVSPPIGTPPAYTSAYTSPAQMAKVRAMSLGAPDRRVPPSAASRSIKGETGDLKARFGGRKTRRTRKVRIPVKKNGDLTNLGYSLSKKSRSRHSSLKKAVRKFGRATVSRKLNALAVFNKRRHPATARKARADRKYAMTQ